jgi:chromosome segregation ATPase
MSTFAKIMVVVNFVLAIAFLAAAGTLHGAAESWKSKHDVVLEAKNQQISALEGQIKAKQGEADQARSELRSQSERTAAAEAQLKGLADSNANLMRENEQKNTQIASLTAANTTAADALKVAVARNEQLSNDLSNRSADLEKTRGELTTVSENLARAEQRADTAEKGLAAGEATNKSLTEQVDEANTLLTAYRTQFGNIPSVAITQPVKGVVQAASAKDDVYVISVGSKDGVKAGYEFVVSRGDRYVSTIVIDSVFPNHAAGHTKTGMRKLDVQAGDAVATGTGL